MHPVGFFDSFEGSGLYFTGIMGHKGYQVLLTPWSQFKLVS